MFFVRQRFIWIFFVDIIVVLGKPSTNLPRQYLVRKDFFNGIKAGEFSVMDPSEKNLFYRIESLYHVLQRVEIIRYPQKKKTAELNSNFRVLMYRGEFSILNETKNRWIKGNMEQNFRWLQVLVIIRWDGHQINMTSSSGDWTYRCRDETNQLVAEYRLHIGPILSRQKYDLKVYTNDYPEEIYLLIVAAHDRIRSARRKG